MEMLGGVAVALRFVLELVGLAAAGRVGYHYGGGGLTGVVVAAIAAAVVIVIWGLFFAPRSRSALSLTGKILGGAGLLLLIAIALVAAKEGPSGAAFAIVIVADTAVLLVTERR
jgi:Protein of unknown function (DUF2568)